MTLKILSCWTPSYEPLGTIAHTSINRYSMSRYNVTKECGQAPVMAMPLDLCWSKVYFILRVLGALGPVATRDWFLWMDADSQILDHKYDWKQLVDNDAEIVFSSDKYGLCSGVFFFRDSAWCLDFFRLLWRLGPTNPQTGALIGQHNARACEQNSIKALAALFPEVADKFRTIPDSIIANPETKPQPDSRPFIRHYWANDRSIEVVAAEMSEDAK